MAEKRKTNRFWILGKKGLDTNLIVITMFLIIFGLIMVYSASYYKCSITKAFGYDSMYMLKNQAIMSVVGLITMLVVSNINYHFWKKKFVVMMAGGLSIFFTLVLLTRFFGQGSPLNFSITANGATRWVKFGPINFQVAEPVKIAVIVITSWLVDKYGAMELHWKKFTLKHWYVTAIILAPGVGLAGFLGIISSNMSSALIIAIIGVLMYFAWHPKSAIFYLAAIAGVVLAGLLIYVISQQNAVDAEEGFRLTRIRAWLDPYSYQSDESFQSLQALYAIGSGGLFGKGPGNSIQKLGQIPEPYNDFIFAIVCEELGVMGASLLILMFIYLLYRIFIIAQRAEDLFGRMLATGVFCHIALQVVLNIAVVTAVLPNTGVTLPFISYGGSSMVSGFIMLGLLMAMAKKE